MELEKFTSILSWTATAVLIAGSAVNGLGYYPAGPIILSTGGVIWCVIAVIMRNWPLTVTNLVMSVVGLGTVIYNLGA